MAQRAAIRAFLATYMRTILWLCSSSSVHHYERYSRASTNQERESLPSALLPSRALMPVRALALAGVVTAILAARNYTVTESMYAEARVPYLTHRLPRIVRSGGQCGVASRQTTCRRVRIRTVLHSQWRRCRSRKVAASFRAALETIRELLQLCVRRRKV